MEDSQQIARWISPLGIVEHITDTDSKKNKFHGQHQDDVVAQGRPFRGTAVQIRYDQGLAMLIIGRLVRHHGRASCLVLVHELNPSLAGPGLCLCFGNVLQPGGVVRHPTIRRAERNAQRENATDLNPGLAIRSAGVLVHVLLQSIHELVVLIFGTCHCQAGIIRRKTLIASTVKTWCCKNPWFPCGAGAVVRLHFAVRLFPFLSDDD